jgi:hypothetical protein
LLYTPRMGLLHLYNEHEGGSCAGHRFHHIPQKPLQTLMQVMYRRCCGSRETSIFHCFNHLHTAGFKNAIFLKNH